MHLTVPGEARARRRNVAASGHESRRRISSRSLLLWGEHCTECAMPGCYASCAFYTPRQDLRCRRFAQGIEIIRDDDGAVCTGVSFRKWGKLEAEGRLSFFATKPARSIESLCGWVDTALDVAVPFDRSRNFLARAFNRAKSVLLSRGAQAEAPDAFVIECLSETAERVEFTFTLRNKSAASAFFQQRFELVHGYNYLAITTDAIRERVDLSGELIVQIEPLGAPQDNHFVFTFLDFVQFEALEAAARPAAAARRSSEAQFCKCVVWDLDNTIWQGILVEDGLENLKLDPRVVAAIKELDRRGILQSVASKNNEREAIEALEHFGLREFFLYPQIHWGPKSESLAAIAARLNIGIDAFAFIDDQPFELAEVRSSLPSVTTISAGALDGLLARPIFDVPLTAESQRRRMMYREEEQRELALRSTGSDFVGFLRSCGIELILATLDEENFERVFELAQRTNQLNYAGRRLERRAIEDLEKDNNHGAYVLSCRDRFGDYGIIGFAVVDIEAFVVDDFFMSCRVQGKFVDHAFFGFLLRRARAAGAACVAVQFRATGRNELARQALADMGFRPVAEAEGVVRYVVASAEEVPHHDIVALLDRTEGVRSQPSPRVKTVA